jgi:hypothetical protein
MRPHYRGHKKVDKRIQWGSRRVRWCAGASQPREMSPKEVTEGAMWARGFFMQTLPPEVYGNGRTNQYDCTLILTDHSDYDYRRIVNESATRDRSYTQH